MQVQFGAQKSPKKSPDQTKREDWARHLRVPIGTLRVPFCTWQVPIGTVLKPSLEIVRSR